MLSLESPPLQSLINSLTSIKCSVIINIHLHQNMPPVHPPKLPKTYRLYSPLATSRSATASPTRTRSLALAAQVAAVIRPFCGLGRHWQYSSSSLCLPGWGLLLPPPSSSLLLVESMMAARFRFRFRFGLVGSRWEFLFPCTAQFPRAAERNRRARRRVREW